MTTPPRPSATPPPAEEGNYDAVLFDAAETLFTTRGSVGAIYSGVAQKFGSTASPSAIQEAFRRHFPHSGPLSSDTEKAWWKDVVHRVFSDVGMIGDFDLFFDEVYDLFRDSRGWMLFPETRQVLKELRHNQLKLGVISNFDSRLYSVLEDLHIRSFFDTVTICSETGTAKPQPEIFHAAIHSLGVEPGRILFTGDSLLDDFQAGQNVGLAAFLLDRSGRYSAMQSVRRFDQPSRTPSSGRDLFKQLTWAFVWKKLCAPKERFPIMKTRHTLLFVLLAVLVIAVVPAMAAPCESLSTLKLANTTITSAQSIPAGPAAGGGGRGGAAAAPLPAYCRVQATIAPTSDSVIKVEVWMPAAGWNGKFQGVGNGAWLGSITTNALATAIQRGYAAASTDTGHEGGSASFALGHPEKLIDYGYRAVHEMTEKGKAITAAFYDRGPQYSYFVGCSAGGKQALKEAQMFPADYDGVVAGSPGVNWSGRALLSVWVGQAQAQNNLPREKWAVLNTAALGACDASDGVKDGVIENPLQCKFDPQVVQCKAGDAADCLTAAQVETARKIYGPVIHNRTKQPIVAGFSPGSELNWATMGGAQPFGPGLDLFKYVVFGDPNWDFKTLNWDTHVDQTLKASASMDALDPNLKPYFDRGGKIISYHGWADPQISPGSTSSYYDSVIKTMGGASKVQENFRLFMVPGMNHCGGGLGTDQFDMLTALENWVEKKQAPASIPASRVANGQTVRTRPLCPYPQTATYKGSGSTDDAANFTCK